MTSVNVTENKYSVSVTEGATTVVTVKAPGPQGVQGATGATGAGISAGDKGALTVAANLTDWTLNDSVVTNSKVSASAAIAGTKISPDFGSQNITTTGNAVFGGNLTVSGTTTTIDTTTLRVEDKNIELGKVGSPTDTTADGGGITLLGDTNHTFNWINATDSWTSSEHIALPDNKKLQLGDSQDLQLFHDGSQSILADVGTGQLAIRGGTTVSISNAAGTQVMANFINGGACNLFHAGNTKLTTTASGVTVTGNLLSSTDGNTSISIQDTGHGFPASTIGLSNGGRDFNITAPKDIRLFPQNNENGIVIEANGPVELYHDNVLRCATSADGLDLPDNSKLQLGDSQDLLLYHDGTQSIIQDNGTGGLRLRGENTISLANANGSKVYARFVTDDTAQLYHNNVVRLSTTGIGVTVSGKITSTGDILINNDYPVLAFIDTNNDSDYRLTNANGSFLLYDISNAATRFTVTNAGLLKVHGNVRPEDDNTNALGSTSKRFSTLHTNFVQASTGILFGSDTVDANTLDDYEQGTFTPTLEGSSSNPTVNYHTQSGHYTKIGNVVHIQLLVITNSYSGGSGEWQCGGLPFTASSSAPNSFNFNWQQSNTIDWGSGTSSLGIFMIGNTTKVRARKFASNTDTALQLSAFSNSQLTVFGVHGSYIAA